MTKVRLGIVGAGIIVRRAHLPALRRLSGEYDVVAICGAGRANADAVGSEFGLEVCDSASVMFARTDIDAIDIATPIHLNAQMARDASAAGKHIFLEKPIAGTLADAKDVADIPRRTGVKMLVAETNRYLPNYERAGDLLRNGAIGMPRLFHWANMSRMRAESAYSKTAWRQTPQHIGGYLSDGGVHAMASLQMVGGAVASVQAVTTGFNSELLGDVDTMAVNFTFRSGLVGSMTYSVGAFEHGPGPLTVYGTKGKLSVFRGYVLIETPDGDSRAEVAETDPFEDEFRDFHAAVVHSKPMRTSPEDALNDLALVAAAVQSSITGSVVQMESLLRD